jgi:hypothetical protein
LEDEYNDWGDAWLGTIDEKMNDARSEQKNNLAKMLSKEYQFVADYSLLSQP